MMETNWEYKEGEIKMKLERKLITIITLVFIVLLFQETSVYAAKVKRVSILGDSISTYTGYSIFNYYNTNKMPQKDVFWQRFIDYNSDLELSSVDAVDGSRVYAPCEISSNDCTMQSYYRIDQLDKNGTLDIIIVFGGINDHTDNMMEFCKAYYTMMKRIRQRYPNVMIICVTPYNDDGARVENINFISQVIKNASAEDRNSICVDLRDKIQGNMGSPYMQANGEGFWFHPNSLGHKVIADAIQEEYLKHKNQALYRDSSKHYDLSNKSIIDLKNIVVVPKNDHIDLAASFTGRIGYRTSFSFEARDNSTGKITRSPWMNKNGWWSWYPDSNDNYTITIAMSVNGNGIIDETMEQHFDKPQMGIGITGICAVPTNNGLLYGCTSVGVNENQNKYGRYRTCCWIYSYTQRRWITMSAYEGQNQAWYRVASLPSGVYMMYNSTEKLDKGVWRKLSCKYYNFTIN